MLHVLSIAWAKLLIVVEPLSCKIRSFYELYDKEYIMLMPSKSQELKSQTIFIRNLPSNNTAIMTELNEANKGALKINTYYGN